MFQIYLRRYHTLLIGIMYRLRPFLPLNVLKNVYYSLVYSHIVYAIEVWGSAVKTEMDKILILQKKAMRLMTLWILFLLSLVR